MENKPIYINITSLTIIKILAISILFFVLYQIRGILLVLFVSLILSSALDPWVDKLQKRKIPRGLSVILLYLVMIGVIGSAIYLIIPPIIEQTADISSNFPSYIDSINNSIANLNYSANENILLTKLQENISNITPSLADATSGVFSFIIDVFGGIINFVLIMVFTFYMVTEENAIKKVVWSLTPDKHQVYIMQLINRIQLKIGLWLRGQLILCTIIFFMTWTGLSIMGVKYALVLAILAGIAESIAYLGPIIAAIPAVFLAYNQSWLLAIFVAILYYIIQWTENNILVPKIMQRVVGLNPIISMSVIIIGLSIAGVVGAIFAIPVATAVMVIASDMLGTKPEQN